MKIELRSLKVSKALSQETTAYTAVVCIDGKKAFHASNHGHGACDTFHPIAPFTHKDLADVEAWIKANRAPMQTEYGTLEYDLDLVIGDLITEHDVRKTLDRMLKAKVLVIDERDGDPIVYTYKVTPTPANIAIMKERGHKVVNGDPENYKFAMAAMTPA